MYGELHVGGLRIFGHKHIEESTSPEIFSESRTEHNSDNSLKKESNANDKY